MGLHIYTHQWGCWRAKSHRGHDPSWLIRRLLNITQSAAEALGEAYFDYVPRAQRCKVYRDVIRPDMPTSFREFGESPSELINNLQKPYLQYLSDRGVDPWPAIMRYDLRWCPEGKFQNRLVVPIYAEHFLRTWTSRAIHPSTKPKYKAGVEEELHCKPGDFFLEEDHLTGGELLTIFEGFFDALAVSMAYIPGVSATCIFGKLISDSQVNRLVKIAPLYERVLVCLDKDTSVEGLVMAQELSYYVPNLYSRRFDELTTKDFGSASVEETREIFYKIKGEYS